jgi:hypothetical protein
VTPAPSRPARKAATTATRPPDGSRRSRRTVLVDAENVRRSVWPNISPEELVGLAEEWGKENDVDVRVVFEPEDETADEWLIREASGFAPYWLVTSDRELRELAGGGAERVIGGGSFARELLKRR